MCILSGANVGPTESILSTVVPM